MIKTLNIKLKNELFKIESEIKKLKNRKREIQRKLKEIEIQSDPKISISISKGKYYIAKTRLNNKVLSVYIGKLKFFAGKHDPRVYEIARKKMLLKLNPDLKPENIYLKPKRSVKTIRDHLKAITEDPYDPNYFKKLSLEDKNTFIPYFIFKYLLSEPSLLPILNKLNKSISGLPKEAVYKVLSNEIPKGKYKLKQLYKKRIKTYDDYILTLIANHFQVSKREANEYIDLYLQIEGGKDELIDICKMYGKTEEEILPLLKKK